jgi:hypothetical protein
MENQGQNTLSTMKIEAMVKITLSVLEKRIILIILCSLSKREDEDFFRLISSR